MAGTGIHQAKKKGCVTICSYCFVNKSIKIMYIQGVLAIRGFVIRGFAIRGFLKPQNSRILQKNLFF